MPSPKKQRSKQLNPEEKLQQSVERDAKLSFLVEHSKQQADALAVAKWEVSMVQKDENAQRKRTEQHILGTERAAAADRKATRKARLEELYKNDEAAYNEQLEKMGLAFRRNRY